MKICESCAGSNEFLSFDDLLRQTLEQIVAVIFQCLRHPAAQSRKRQARGMDINRQDPLQPGIVVILDDFKIWMNQAQPPMMLGSSLP